MIPTDLEWPQLGERYDRALRDCVEWIFASYDVLAVLVSGTIVRGNPDPASDLDIYVLHRGKFRERVQRFFGGVACEIFVNPPHRIPEYFEGERLRRRPSAAHMFATGVVLYDPAGVAELFVHDAKRALADQLPGTDAGYYAAATALEDAVDLAIRDRDGALLLLGQAVFALVICRLESERGWLPRGKELLSELRKIDPEAARLACAACSGTLEERLEAGRKLCRRVTGYEGFFEWTSSRD